MRSPLVRASALVPLLLAALLAAAPPARAQEGGDDEAEVKRAFAEGNALMAKKDYAGALARYRDALAKNPEQRAVLYNAGLAGYLAGEPKEAIEHWSKLAGLEPDDWQVKSKLVQAHQAAGDLAARDRVRDEIYALREKGEDAELAEAKYFCREQLDAGGRRILVYEHFDMAGDRAVRYKFLVLDEAGEKVDYRISLGSYEATNRIAKELGELGEGERLWHIDGYYEGGRHATFEMQKGKEPGYDETRQKVLEIVEGKRGAMSSSGPRAPEKEPAEEAEPGKTDPDEKTPNKKD